MLDVPFELAPRTRTETLRALGALLEALTQIDGDQVSALPPLLRSGVRYVFRPGRDTCGQSFDRWCDARTVVAQRHGDCEDLASWMAAERRAAGDPRARAVPFYVNPTLIHVVCVTGSGEVLDPSIALGMPIPPGMTIADFTPRVAGALATLHPW